MSKLQKFVEGMRYWCDVGNLGYDQGNRWDIREGGECDCSSLVYWCLWDAGYLERPKDSPWNHLLWTGTIRNDLVRAGWTVEPVNGKPQVGDVLLNDNKHVAVCTTPGLMSYASIDERGKASGGQAGDQTGQETKTRTYYNYPWNCYLRPPAETEEDVMATKEEVAKAVWDEFIENWNGKQVKAKTMLKAIDGELQRTDDPSGNNVLMKDHDHLKHIAAKQRKMDEKLDKIIQHLGV